MIHFPEPRDVLLRNVQTRMEKHGEQDVAAIDLAISLKGGNTLLDMIHPDLRLALFKPVTEQPGELSLPVDDLPSKRFARLAPPVKFDSEQIGMTLKVAYGATGKADMVLGAVKLSKLRVSDVIEGGSVEIAFNLSTTDVSEKIIGKLSLLQSHEISITLVGPEVDQSPADKQAAARKEAEGLFAEPGSVQDVTKTDLVTPEDALLSTAGTAE